jgi:folate-dependent phosphoribosylglycinamide formyltransferase PurN
MRIVVLCSSPYSETGCAVAARLVQLGHIPIGALTLPSWDRRTLLRKIGQWGAKDSFRYATAKLTPGKTSTSQRIRNLYLESALRHKKVSFRNLYEMSRVAKFPVATCEDHNSPRAIARLKQWSPDVLIFTGGNILKQEVLDIPRLGVLNSHLALLPEIRGMSSPEWSLLCNVPLGITIHFMDSGIDTGPILLRREFVPDKNCDSFTDLRNRMIAEGVELIGEAVTGLDRGTLSPVPQTAREKDSQYFVMHDRLKAVAKGRLQRARADTIAAAATTKPSGGHRA